MDCFGRRLMIWACCVLLDFSGQTMSVIASFFRNIGLLGSGVRNIFKYARLYQGGHPQFLEQDIFRTTVEFDNATVSELDLELLKLIQAKPTITYTELSEQLNLHRATIARHIKSLAEQKVISRIGTDKTGLWKINLSL